MKINCNKCGKVYRMDSSSLPLRNTTTHCRACSAPILIPARSSQLTVSENGKIAKQVGHTPTVQKNSKVMSGKIENLNQTSGQNRSRLNRADQTENKFFKEKKSISNEASNLKSDSAESLITKKNIIRSGIVILLLLVIQIQPLRAIFFDNFIFQKADKVAEECIEKSFKRSDDSF